MRKKFCDQTPILLPRDIEILKFVWKTGIRTYDEINAKFLQNYSKKWTWKILKRLVRLNYLKECRPDQRTILCWQTGNLKHLPKNLRQLKNEVSQGGGTHYYSTFTHDGELRWLEEELEALPIVSNLRPESELRREALLGLSRLNKRELNTITSKIPDCSFDIEWKSEKLKVALELELNHKSNERLQMKLENYIANASFDFVLYVCGNGTTMKTLMRNYKSVLSQSSAVKFAEIKTPIYFTLLSQCKESLKDAPLIGLQDELKISKFLNEE